MSYKFYYIKSTIDYVLVIKDIENNKVEKLKYSLSGVLLNRIVDVIIDNKVVRIKGLETIYITNNLVTKTSNLISLKAIEPYKIKDISWLPNRNIGVIDLETYLNNKDTYVVYALGFKTNLDNEPVVYYIDKEMQNMDNTSIVISAAVTAYARIHISKIKLDILSKGGKIFYSDTDSIVTDLELDEDMVNAKELGKLKLEHKVAKGIFITNKTYCIIDNNNKYINKAKGINT